VLNGPEAYSLPFQPITNLANLNLWGVVNTDGTDSAILWYGNDKAAATNQDSILTLGPNWNNAEFNVFGYGFGSQAVFNPGATVDVNLTEYHTGSLATPTCLITTTTGETNNLTLDGTPPFIVAQGDPTSIEFQESGLLGPTASCPPAVSGSYLIGTWINDNTVPDTRGWVSIDIAASGNNISAHFFGDCEPDPCDAGSASTAFTGTSFKVPLITDFKTQTITLSLAGGTLQVKTFTHFTDNSGRADMTKTETFHKQ
jgi:hypothetical protein